MRRPPCELEAFHATPCPCTCLHTVHPVANHADGCPEKTVLNITYDIFYCAQCYRSLAVSRPYDMEEFPSCEGCDAKAWLLNPLKRHDDTWTSGTHITFRNHGTMNGSKGPQRKTNVYEVLAKGGGATARLGEIRWFGRWRKYCFYPIDGTIYEETCLREIALFIQQETRLYNKRAREKRKAAKA